MLRRARHCWSPKNAPKVSADRIRTSEKISWEGVMNQRRSRRLKRRVTCDISVHDSRHTGVAVELSPHGFFVQTLAAPAVGSTVRVTLRPPGALEIEVKAKISYRRVLPRMLSVATRGGLGCAIVAPSEGYRELLGELTGS